MRILLVVLVCLLGGSAWAQPGKVRGRVVDTTFKQKLSATVSLLNYKDSTVERYAVSNEDGSFELEQVDLGKYLLFVSHEGFSNVFRNVEVTAATPVLNVGIIHLEVQAHDLGTVTVTQSPVVIKGDTTEFNAASFKTKQNATTEDLLKKLPGVQVDKDGNVKAQGEQVQKVLVDGKRFFSNDPKMATRNLPADIVDKVQLYDGQNEQAAFSGFDDGSREKTINIVTKKDRRKGYFGKVTGGIGENERYASNLSANRFNGSQQLSLIAQANNTNQQNFSMQDMFGAIGNMGGGMMRMMSGIFAAFGGGRNFLNANQPGVARTIAAGVNYNDAWSKYTGVSGSYFFNDMNRITNQDRLVQNILSKDSSYFNFENSNSRNENRNHRFNFEIDQRIDSFNSILIRPSFDYQQADNFGVNTTVTTDGKSSVINQLDQLNMRKSCGYDFDNSILWRHRFGKKGRTLSLNVTTGLNASSSDNNIVSRTYFKLGGDFRRDTMDQINNVDRDAKEFGARLSYTEPVGKKGMLEAVYNYNYTLNSSEQNTLVYDALNDKYVPFGVLNNSFENTFISHRGGINYRRKIDNEWSYTLGMALQRASLNSFNKTTDSTLRQNFVNMFPTLQLNYSKNRVNNIRFEYRGSTRQPSIDQLQDVVNNNNPLNIRKGNPALEQEFSHNFSFYYTKINIFSFKNFVISINGSITQNKIATATYYNRSQQPVFVDGIPLIGGAQFEKPVNLDGAYTLFAFMNYGFPVKKPKSNINFTTTVVHNTDVNLVNDVKSYTKTYVLGELITYNMNIKDKLDLNLTSSSNYTIANNSQQPLANGDYFYQTFTAEPTYSTKSGWIFSMDFDYTFYRGQAAGFNQSVPLVNAAIAKTVFKDKKGELRLSVFDLLNQNQSISRTVQQNIIVDTRTNVLTRYVMLSFTYNIGKFGGQKMPPMFNIFRRMPGGGRVN